MLPGATDSIEVYDSWDSEEPLPPRFGGYEVLRKLGEGGMGAVFEARAPDGTLVAIKALHTRFAKNKTHAARLKREARAATAVSHPNLVQILDFGFEGGTPFLVMELLRGKTLHALLCERPQLTLTEVADIALPLCAALSTLHAAGVIHRDIKPENIFLAEDAGEIVPMFLDFGLSKLSEESDGLTKTRTIVGTPMYMSPEHAISAKEICPASDVYSLGVVLYEASVGRHPIAGDEHIMAVFNAILNLPFPDPREHVPTFSREAAAALEHAMARDPAQRATAAELGAALAMFASPRAQERYAPEGTRSQATSTPRPSGIYRSQASLLGDKRFLLALLAFLLGCGVLLFAATRGAEPVPERALPALPHVVPAAPVAPQPPTITPETPPSEPDAVALPPPEVDPQVRRPVRPRRDPSARPPTKQSPGAWIPPL